MLRTHAADTSFDLDSWQSCQIPLAILLRQQFNRTRTVAQYAAPVRDRFANLNSCPDELLLWFHHVDWDYRMSTSRTVWDELCWRYNNGVDYAKSMQTQWGSLRGKVDLQRFNAVQQRLEAQLVHATRWRNICVRYFQSVNHKKLPTYLNPP